MPEEKKHTVSVELPIKFWFSRRGGVAGGKDRARTT
jgi:hypothetical protein